MVVADADELGDHILPRAHEVVARLLANRDDLHRHVGLVQDEARGAAQDVGVQRAGQSPVRRDDDQLDVLDRALSAAAGTAQLLGVGLLRGQVGHHLAQLLAVGPAGRHPLLRACASSAAETISIARVICDMLPTLRMRRRISRVLATCPRSGLQSTGASAVHRRYAAAATPTEAHLRAVS